MRQLNFLEPGKLDWKEVEEPRLEGDGEALVKPVALATCDLDKMIVRGALPLEGPFPFGHECVAEVTEVGNSVSGAKPGDLVSVPFQISCGECEACRRRNTGNCTAVARGSAYGLGPLSREDWGGLASDLVRVPFADPMLIPVPDGVEPAAVASLSDNIPDAWRTVGPQLDAEPDAPVLICGGSGSIPIYAAGIAVGLGAERVDFAGGHQKDREIAEQLGATLIDEEFPDKLGPYPITVDASGDEKGLACALRSTSPDGTCTSIGIYFQPLTPVPLFDMFTKGIHFHTGRCHARPGMEPVLELVRAGKFEPRLVTGETAAWDDAAEAIAEHRSKLVVTRGD